MNLRTRIREGPEQGLYVLLGVAAVLLLFVVGFVVKNARGVRVDFVLFSTNASLLWVMLIPFLIGAVAGYALARVRARESARPVESDGPI